MGINQALAMAVLLRNGIGCRTWIRPDSDVEADILTESPASQGSLAE